MTHDADFRDEDLARAIARNPLLSREEEVELGRRIRAGGEDADRAVEELVTANLRLALKVAREYVSNAPEGILVEDAEQVAFGGLVTAARKFDPDKGVKFISYAVWWIRAELQRLRCAESRPFRVPTDIETLSGQMSAAREALEADGSDPTPEALAEVLDLPLRTVKRVLRANGPVVSIDADVPSTGSDRPGTVAEIVVVGDPGPDADAEAADRQTIVADLVDQLPDPRDRMVIRRAYGLDGSAPWGLQQLSHSMGVSRERVRQLRDRALERLRELGGASLEELAPAA